MLRLSHPGVCSIEPRLVLMLARSTPDFEHHQAHTARAEMLHVSFFGITGGERGLGGKC